MRSLLFVPADSERKLASGLESGADALILDLEDSVAAANRPTARKLARAFLEAHGSDRIRRYVRINPLASGWRWPTSPRPSPAGPTASCCRNARRTTCARSTITCRPSRRRRARRSAPPHHRDRHRDAAACSRSAVTPASRRGWRRSPGAPRIWRPASAATTARSDGVYDGPYRLARSLCLLAAAAAGVQAIDTIYTDFRDEAGLAGGIRGGAALRLHRQDGDPSGAAGRDQRNVLGQRRRTRWAEQVVAAFAANPDAGTLALDGKMIDRPHLVLARRLLGLSQE